MAASDDYNNDGGGLRHMQRDVHDAHTSSQVAKMLSYLALAGAILSLALAIWALNNAGEAQSTANRAQETSQQVR